LFLQPAQADVQTRVRILDEVQAFLGFYEVREKSAERVVSDLLTRDDAFSNSTSFAAADLGTGELKVNATGYPRMAYTNAFIAQATASMSDMLTIVGPGSDPIAVALVMNVHGLHSTPASGAGAGTASSFVRGKLEVDAAFEDAELLRSTRYDGTGMVVTDTLTGVRDWVGAAPVAGSEDQFALVLRFDTSITPGVPFAFRSEIFASANYSPSSGTDPLPATPIVSDFANTALIEILLPQEYTITSESGVFLAGPIPEPGTWAMMLAGLGVLATVATRRKAAATRRIRQ